MTPQVPGSATCTLLIVLIVALLPVGCRKVIKTKVRVETAPAHRQALESTLPELVQRINTLYAGVEHLVAKLKLELEGHSPDSGYNERYRKAPAQLISKRPDSIRLNVLNPLTRTTVVAMASRQARFQIWAPTKNKFVTGSTLLEREYDNPLYNVRPEHVLPAILIEPLPTGPAARVFLIEEKDARSKFYVIHELHSQKMRLKRRLRIERSRLELVRQDYFDSDGSVASSIRYSEPVAVGRGKGGKGTGGEREAGGKGTVYFSGLVAVGQMVVNTGVVLERPREHYTLRLQLEPNSLRIDRELEDRHFQLPVPPGAELIKLQ